MALQRIRHIGYAIDPLGSWPLGVDVSERYRLVVPDNLPAGIYSLAAGLGWAGSGQTNYAQPDDPAIRAQGGFVMLGRVAVASR